MSKIKKNRIIVFASSLIGLSITYLVYYFFMDKDFESPRFLLSIIAPLGVIISMGILIFSISKKNELL